MAQSKEDGQEGVFEKVDVEANVDAKEWIQHLQKTLQKPIEKAAKE